jgi:tRNA pseudouridine55 synthase
VHIDSLTISEWSPPQFTLDVVCSAGTYIRSLAHDLGVALGVGAHLAGLTRTASGMFTLEKAITLDNLLNEAQWQQYLISPSEALAGWPVIHLDAASLDHVLHGRAVTDSTAPDGALALAYAPDGQFTAILIGEGGTWKPHKVFPEQA